MKILYLNNQFYLHGGIEKILSQKVNYLIEEYQYKVILCTSEHKNQSYVYPLNKSVNHIDLEINYNRSKSYFHPINLLKAFKHFIRLKRTIKKLKPNIIISVNFTPEQYFLPFIEKGTPKVKEFHSSGVTLKSTNNLAGKLKYQLFKLFDKYDSVVVLNKDEKKYYPFKKIEVIPNFIKIPTQNKSLNKEKTIIAAGRLSPVKQFDHLIKAWHMIADEFPDWQVKIFGDGDDEIKDDLQGLIGELKVPNIKLMGSTTQLKEEMEKASIYAMTSATECFPMVLLEAQAAQLAIISYDCPNGPRNIIKENRNGVLLPLNSIELFAHKLSEMISSNEYRRQLAINGEVDVLRLEIKEIMPKWTGLFNRLTHKI
ncbi:glycosyltransferase [Mesonia sp. HuA40]|uniref:glycosyltransferase n=1 Tax=Mesonia sp. HuA40 TaxID=2602761 RepID=UPI0011CA87DB|nr:glycosyltransferase [Mesonia sp. HuA40]TXK75412.1 glycosyltransferase family 4 protein [Mesonia sp. HuA40]